MASSVGPTTVDGGRSGGGVDGVGGEGGGGAALIAAGGEGGSNRAAAWAAPSEADTASRAAAATDFAVGGKRAGSEPAEDAEQQKRAAGVELLRRMGRQFGGGGLYRAQCVWWAIGQVGTAVTGVVLLHIFDSAHAVYGWVFLANSLLGFLAFVAIRHPVTKELFDQLEHLDGAVMTAVEVEKKSRTFPGFAVVIVVFAILFGLFLFDLDDHPGLVHHEHGWRVAALVANSLGILYPAVGMLRGEAEVGAMCLDMVTEAARGVADAVDAGAPRSEIASMLVHLRRALVAPGVGELATAMVAGYAQFVAAFLLAAVVVIQEDGAAPAVFWGWLILPAPLIYAQSPAPVLVNTHIGRIPVSLAVRATEMDADLEAGEGGTPSAGAGTKWPRDDALALDALAQRIQQRLRLGWYAMGVPLSGAMLRSVRLVTVPILVSVLRSHVDLGF